MKIIVCKGGKATVLRGVPDNAHQFTPAQLTEEYFNYYGVSLRNF